MPSRFAAAVVTFFSVSLVAVLAHAQEVDEADEPVEASYAAAAAKSLGKGPAVGDEELKPLLSGKAKTARALLDKGNATAALAQLPAKPKDAPTRWLRALALKAAHRCKEARPELLALAQAGGPLRDRANFLAGMCAVEQGDGPAAVAALQAVSPASVDAAEAYLEAARQLRKLRPPAKAAPAVEDVLAPFFTGAVRGDAAVAHLIAGEALLAAGDKQRALDHFQTAWLDFPLSAAGDSARSRARALAPKAPVSEARLVRRIEAMVDGGRLRAAASEAGALKLPKLCAGGCPGDKTPASLLKAALRTLLPDAFPQPHQPTPADVARKPAEPADPLACRAKLAQGRAYRKLRQNTQALAALAPVVLRCGEPDVRAKALFVLAQIRASRGEADAEQLWLALAKNFPKSTLADDALHAAAMARRKEGDADGARTLWKQLVAEHGDGDLAAEALFQLFWGDWEQKHPRQGIQWLDQLAALDDADGADNERARYWRARALLEPAPNELAADRAKAQAAARDDLLWLARERPLTYHGLLARSRLAELAEETEAKLEETEAARIQRLAKKPKRGLHMGPLQNDVHLLAAIEYLRLSQPREAMRELAAIDRMPARRAGAAGHESLALIADLYSRAGDLRSAHNVIRTDLRALLRHPASALAVRAAQLAYPLAFRPAIDAVSSRAGIPADLLQALMREESALDPRAMSPVGARGLTQLMPGTAREVAKRLKLRFATPMLFEPEINIRIGGTYFGQLYSHFKNAALALASYNAGPGNVGGWMKVHGELPLDAFVEEIPLDETRGYVKRCLRSFAAYRFLYGAGPARVPHVGQALAGELALTLPPSR